MDIQENNEGGEANTNSTIGNNTGGRYRDG